MSRLWFSIIAITSFVAVIGLWTKKEWFAIIMTLLANCDRYPKTLEVS
ncbi:MAG: hypothetical protein KME30_12945 [Iphinoe sp. HA4291-MV1]|jgi:hypothetical protein|nr:hypothetical protein [Iphinoe sp. HA4291-MV1]